MRKVTVYTRKRIGNNRHFSKVEDGKGYAIFHQWGVDHEEYDEGPGSFSTAVIERTDGTVENIPVELIKFVDV